MIASKALKDVVAERFRQTHVEGFTEEHDDKHIGGQMALAAAGYALASASPDREKAMISPTIWPWDGNWWKPTNRRRDLVKAGALILAEIERLDRAASGSEAVAIIRGFLDSPEIADCAPEDLDNETRDLERRARQYLTLIGQVTINELRTAGGLPPLKGDALS
jgi:hypothetical protein